MRRLLLVGALLLSACGGDDGGSAPAPVVDLIPDAIAAVEDFYGGPQEYFEISAGLEKVGIIVAVEGGTEAEQASYDPDGDLEPPVSAGEATGVTFVAAQIDFDPERIFEPLRAELGDPAVIDFAIQGGPNGTVVYDATIASSAGGVLLVLLGPNGDIRAVQGQ